MEADHSLHVDFGRFDRNWWVTSFTFSPYL